MSADDKPRSRKLTDHEQALWHGVTRSVAPLKRRRASRDADAAAQPAKKAVKPAATTRAHAAPMRPAIPKGPPPLAPIDRRTRQRIARGSEAIDARIDLHGRTQSEAHDALLRFLRRAQHDGARTVLVITGKGGGDESKGRGVLKRQVPMWLALPEFRALVVGFGDAAISHGGEGALYVRVRRIRSAD
jgi:DNA-nicking Smr family endonuclease